MRISLVTRVPENLEKSDVIAIRKQLLKISRGLDVVVKDITMDGNELVEIEFQGNDQTIFLRILKDKYGIAPGDFINIDVNQIQKGIIVDIGKVGFGLYINLGFRRPLPDALYPLYSMRAQLCDGREISVREISRQYGFGDNFPLEIRIVKIDRNEKKLWIELSEGQLDKLFEWHKYPYERIIVFNISRDRLKKLLKLYYKRDLLTLESLSLTVHSCVLKIGVEADKLIKDLSTSLQGIHLSVFKPYSLTKVRRVSEWFYSPIT